MLKTVLTSAALGARPIKILFGITVSIIAWHFVQAVSTTLATSSTLATPTDTIPFYEIWQRILDDYLWDVIWLEPWQRVPLPMTPFGIHYSNRAIATHGLMSLVWTTGTNADLHLVLDYARYTASCIEDWQSALPMANQNILESRFQVIFDNAIELIEVCNNAIENEIPREDTLDNIYPLFKNIFTEYCSISSHLGVSREFLISLFQEDMLFGMSSQDAIAYVEAFVNAHLSGIFLVSL